jgi:hypothetical protein
MCRRVAVKGMPVFQEPNSGFAELLLDHHVQFKAQKRKKSRPEGRLSYL